MLAAPLTRTLRGIPTEVPLDTWDGLPQPCAATLGNLELVPKAYLVERISWLAPGKVAEACVALANAFDC